MSLISKKRKNCDPSSPSRTPFWNSHCALLSRYLWLPNSCHFTHSSDSHWFTSKFSYPSVSSSVTLDLDLPDNSLTPPKKRKKVCPSSSSTEKEQPAKCTRIKLHPSKECRETLRQWFGTVRWTYNTALHAINEKKVSWALSDLRALCVNKENLEDSPNSWALDVPYDVRDEAIRDLVKALKINKNKEEKFEMKFRSRKAPQESIVIHAKHWTHKKGPYHELKQGLRSTEELPEDLVYDSRLIRTKLGEYYMCIPKPLGHKGESQTPIQTSDYGRIISLDPGVRTFITGYSPNGLVCEWGKGDATRLGRLCNCIAKLRSKATRVNHRKRYRLKKVILRVHKKIKNLVKDLHCKLAKWLCSNYDTILIPSFGTSQMVKRMGRKINKSTAWKMLTWSHYSFRMRLINKAKEYPGVRVVTVTEEYTSKTCTRCGKINMKLGGSKEFKCNNGCGMVLDRDFNGARNILLKYARVPL